MNYDLIVIGGGPGGYVAAIRASTANLFSRNFKTIAIASVVLNITGISLGLILAYKMNIPSGASIVCVQVLFFAVAKAITAALSHSMVKNSLAQKTHQHSKFK